MRTVDEEIESIKINNVRLVAELRGAQEVGEESRSCDRKGQEGVEGQVSQWSIGTLSAWRMRSLILRDGC